MARIAYHSSHVILSVQPTIGTDSEFSKELHSLASKRTPGVLFKEPEVTCSATILTGQTADTNSRSMLYDTM